MAVTGVTLRLKTQALAGVIENWKAQLSTLKPLYSVAW